MTLRLVLADDHAVVLQGLRALLSLETDLEVVATCVDGREVVEAVQIHGPDVLVMDAVMPGVTGVQALELLDEAELRVPTVILSATLEDPMLLRCMELEVEGLVLKESAADTLVEAIRAASRGERSIPRLLSERAAALIDRRAEMEEAALTPREKEIAGRAAAGLSNKRIAAELGLAEGTVKLHLHSAFKKLGVSNRVQLSLRAREYGWD